MEDSNIAKLWDMIKDINMAMMTTLDPDGQLRARPMATYQTEFDGDLWFFTNKNSGKVDSIDVYPSINLSYGSPDKSKYVSVSGEVELVEDRAMIKELWNPLLRAWFPEGVDDPDIVLLRVKILDAEFWDSSTSRMVRLFGLIRSAVTGKPYVPSEGEHQKI